jgi:2-succinyl-5-enolpyruvyl-6-hydroxy-3-cyclohexene-1-carboxylate synthase
MLPIEGFDPPFTEQFRTPHGLDFQPTGDLYDLAFHGVASRGGFRESFTEATASDGTHVVEVRTVAADSHRRREALADRLAADR